MLSVSELSQKIAQSHTANQPTAPWGRAKERYLWQDNKQTVKLKQPAL